MVAYIKKFNKVIGLIIISAIVVSGCAWNKVDKPEQDTLNQSHEIDVLEDEPEINQDLPTSEQVVIDNDPVFMYATEDVNIRLGEGESYDVVHVLERGTLIEVIHYENEWSQMIYKDETVYISSKYLSSDEPAERRRIVIDAGHQNRGEPEKEPNGPGASTMKAKVSSGTRGVSTGVYEYELNLLVTLQLRDELESRGYEVILVRDNHEVNISNVERAMVANNHNADCFVRIHANGDNDQNVEGMLTICQTINNPYNAEVYQDSYRLSKEILDGMVKQTGAKDRGIWETDTMTGINWCKVPSTIVEMGFMSNPKEDQLLNTISYQEKIVQGIADGIDCYFAD